MVESVSRNARIVGAPMLPVLLLAPLMLASVAAHAASMGPPMLDINRQCDGGRHNTTAMSECIVAESEARSAILQKWDKISDANAEKCVKLGRKAKRFPYSAIAKCLAIEPIGTAAPAPAPAAQ